MLESNELRKVLEDTGSKLAVMISDHAYHTTVEDGYTEAVKPLDFRPMDIRVKNAEIKVRVYTPAPPSDLTKRRGVAVAVSAVAAASKYPKRKDASAIPPEKGTTAPRNRKIRMTSAKTNISHGQPFPERPRRTASTATVGSPLGSPLSSHAHMPPSRAMIAVDIEQYSGYPDFLRPSIRQAMRKIIGSALEQVGISWDPVERDDKVYSRDDGDGFTIILSDRDTARLVDAVPELNNELHRRARDFDPPLRMRAAIHHGPIDHSGSGIARIELARMLGSNELRKALENTDSRFAVMISDHAYHTAVEGGYTAAVKPHNFQPVDIQVKKTELKAWVHTPALPSDVTKRRGIAVAARATAAAVGTAATIVSHKLKDAQVASSSFTAPNNRPPRMGWNKRKNLPIVPMEAADRRARSAPTRKAAVRALSAAASSLFPGTKNRQESSLAKALERERDLR